MIQAGAGGFAGNSEPAGMHQHTSLHAQHFGGFLERSFKRRGVKRGRCGKGVPELFQSRPVLWHKILLRGLGVVFNLIGEVKTGVSGQLTEEFEFTLARIEGGFDVGEREFVRVNASLGKGMDGQFVKTVVI